MPRKDPISGCMVLTLPAAVKKPGCFGCKHAHACYRWENGLMVVYCTVFKREFPEKLIGECDKAEFLFPVNPECQKREAVTS